MKDITQIREVQVGTLPVRGHEISTGGVVMDGQIIQITAVSRMEDARTVTLHLWGPTARFSVVYDRDTVFDAIVWPTCLANDAVPVKHAQIIRDQVRS